MTPLRIDSGDCRDSFLKILRTGREALCSDPGRYADARLDAVRYVKYELSDGRAQLVVDEDRIGFGLRLYGEGTSAFIVQEGSVDVSAAISQASAYLARAPSSWGVRVAPPQSASPFELLSDPVSVEFPVLEAIQQVLSLIRSAIPTTQVVSASLVVQLGDRGVITSEGTLAVRPLSYSQFALNLRVNSKDRALMLPMTLSSPRPEGLLGRCCERLPSLRLACAALSRATSFMEQPVRGSVVLSPWIAAVLVHEAFGHACEADRYRNLQATRRMLGISLGPSTLGVTDNALSSDLTGGLPFDDEGVRCRPIRLIHQGRWVAVLHSRETAAAAGVTPAGVARTTSFRFRPICRSRITVVAPGNVNESSLVASANHGLYIDIPYGGHVRGGIFSIAAASAIRIRNGKLAESVGPVVLRATPLRILRQITGIADNIAEVDADFCNRGNQTRLPVSMRTPSLLLEDVEVRAELRR